MPRTDVTDVRQFDKFQGIDVRDDAESNTASDMLNLVIDSTGRLTRAKESEAIGSYGSKKSGFYFASYDDEEITAEIDDLSIPPSIGNLTQTTITANGSYANKCFNYVESVLLISDSFVAKSGEDFDYEIIDGTQQKIVCDITFPDTVEKVVVRTANAIKAFIK